MIIRSYWLLAGGALSLGAAVLHLACIAGGASWYRFFGAGEGLARAAERGALYPALITAAIALILTLWAGFAFSGAGLLPRFPLLPLALIGITAIYLVRGAVVFAPSALARPDLSPSFLFWSSLVVLTLGVVHAVGTWRAWSSL